ncbi:MAG: VWA domain-containing protein, partial [Firmicutes bacterium]|nr:VWA domain-containing protein [Bacillota bacterium]
MRNKLLRIALSLMVCLSLVMGTVSAAFAEEEWTVPKSKEASEIELDPTQKQTEITLKLPSGEYQNKIDIVFVMDSSSSTDLGTQFIESATTLFDSVVENNPTVDLKIGVILFTGSANDAIDYVSDGEYSGLTLYNDDTKDLFKAPAEGATTVFNISEILTKDEFRDAFGRGSGPHVGLDLAEQWLQGDAEVEDDHKYVIFFTDGKAYIWANEDHEPTTIFAQWYNDNKYTLDSGGKPSLSQVQGKNKDAYAVDVLDKTGKSNIFTFPKHSDGKFYFEDLYNSTSEELTGVTKWDQPCLYANADTWRVGTPDGEVIKHEVTNGMELFGAGGTYGNYKDYQTWNEYIPNDDWADLVYMEANPFMVIENADGTYTFDTENINPNYYQYHVDNLQKGQYKAAHLWTDMGEKYNCAVVTYDSGGGSGLHMVDPFKEWLRKNSAYGASKANASQVSILFEGIDNSIRYLVGRGIVTDPVASEFDLIMDGYGEGTPFKLTVGGEEIEAEAGATAANTWNFGANDDGAPLYSVEWNEGEKTITWYINVPVENANPVHLSYILEWNGAGERQVDTPTNGTTTLEYWKSTNIGNTSDGTDEFEVPDVIYTDARVSYDPNGGEGEIEDENNPYKVGTEIDLKDADGFSFEGHYFVEWNTDPDGDGESYDEGDAY